METEARSMPAVRRLFGALLAFTLVCGGYAADKPPNRSSNFDVVLYGGTPGGIAAAVAAAREGASVLLLEPTRHVGGLHTSGLSVAEWAQNRDTFGGILDEFFRRVGQAYGSKSRKYEWESKVAERVYQEMLREAKVTVLFDKLIDQVDKRQRRIVSLTTTDGSTYAAKVFIDASYKGDLKNKPYEIPYRSLTPKAAECENLLVPVCLSASHVTFSSIRVEEVWMLLGQAAGTAAAVGAKLDRPVQQIEVEALRTRLRIAGLYLNRQLFEPSPDSGVQLTRPTLAEDEPAPGKFVRQQSEEFRGTGVYHGLYLPQDWQPGAMYPVIVEYAPNRWEALTGKVEDCRLGFHLSGGTNFIWIVMPYVHPVGQTNVVWWWGDEDATIKYCLTNLRRICDQYGGDPNAVFFTGFSRGAIAASYLGLRNDVVADVWLGFLPHSHIDGGRFTPDGARERLGRTRGRPTFITYGSDDDGKNESPKGGRILRELGFPVVERELAALKHTDRFLETNSLIRREMRAWMAEVLARRPGTSAVRGRVVDRAGEGIPGVRVQCGRWHWSMTDANGDYTIPSLVPGRRLLVASKPGLRFTAVQTEVAAGGKEFNLGTLVGEPAPAN